MQKEHPYLICDASAESVKSAYYLRWINVFFAI